MKCRKVRMLLPDYIGGEIHADQRREMNQHLKGCPDCIEDMRRLQAVWDGVIHQPLPLREEGFWQEFTRGVMRETSKQRAIPPKEKRVLAFPRWRFLVPAAAVAVVMLVSVIVLRGDFWGPVGHVGKSPSIPLNEQETIGEAADSLAFAPQVTDEGDLLSREPDLKELIASARAYGIPLRQTDMTTITEALTQKFGEEDIYEKLEGLTGKELEEFYQLLNSKYPYS